MSVPSIEKLTALEPWTVVGVRAGDLLDCLASAADAVTAARTELSTAGEILADYREFGTVAELREQVKRLRRDRDEARRERDDAGLRWAEHYNGAMGALESRLEAVRALHPASTSTDAPAHCLEDGEAWPCDTLRAAAGDSSVSVAPQPEPDLLTAVGGFCVPLFPQSDGSVIVGRATAPEPPASDEPARCTCGEAVYPAQCSCAMCGCDDGPASGTPDGER